MTKSSVGRVVAGTMAIVNSVTGEASVGKRFPLLSKVPLLVLGSLIVLMAGGHPGSMAQAGQGSSATLTMVVGSTNFFETEVVAELYAQVMEAQGVRVARRYGLGSREILAPALEHGDHDFYVEYLATYLTYLTRDPTVAGSDAEANYARLQVVARAREVTALPYAPASNVNAFVVRRATAERYGLTSLSNLSWIAPELRFGGPPECANRPYCLPGLERTYGIRFGTVRALDVGGPLTLRSLRDGSIDVGLLFSTDPVLAGEEFVALVDDRHLQLADHLLPVMRTPIRETLPHGAVAAINQVSAALTVEELRWLNRRFTTEEWPAATVAAEWLAEQGILPAPN
jgi:osmoprotectant transport system substrate-binding protein